VSSAEGETAPSGQPSSWITRASAGWSNGAQNAAPNDQATAPGGAAPNAAPASRNTSLGIEGGTAELSVRAAFADGYRIAPSSGFERGSFDDWANGHGNCPLNWHDVSIMTTSGGGGI
jgi:hypothetical protein